jgi:hypothetical protein
MEFLANRRSNHGKSCSPYFSIFKARDLHRGLDRAGVVRLAIAVLGFSYRLDRRSLSLARARLAAAKAASWVPGDLP